MPVPAGGGDVTTPDRFATAADLALLLQSSTTDVATAELLIESATAVIQAVTGQRIIEVVDDQVVLDLDEYDGGGYLLLPERPVTAVSAVVVGSTAVTDFSVQLRRSRLHRVAGWSSASTRIGSPSTVTVTYTHGYPDGDQRLQLARSAALSLAAGAYVNPSGAIREQIDDYSVAYEAVSSRMEASPFLLAALRKRYGSPTGSVRLLSSR